jgi:hypothetical protein
MNNQLNTIAARLKLAVAMLLALSSVAALPSPSVGAAEKGTQESSSATIRPQAPQCAMNFSDVSEADYFYMAVRFLYCQGVISGYPDNTFLQSRPSRTYPSATPSLHTWKPRACTTSWGVTLTVLSGPTLPLRGGSLPR